MKFTDAELDDFIAMTKVAFGTTIDRAEAHRQAMALVSLVKRVYRPMTREEMISVVNQINELP